jgi:hypothetical protein
MSWVDRTMVAGSRPMAAQCRSSTALRRTMSSIVPKGGPGTFQMSACSATTRRVRSPMPPISTGGPGRCTGGGTHTVPCVGYQRPSKSNGASSAHIRRISVSASPSRAIPSPGATSRSP